MNALWGVLIGVVIFAAGAAAGDMVSEEVRTRLDEVPMTLVRLAARRAGADVSADLLDEWQGELYEILRGAEAKPITRLWKGLRFSVGLIVAAPAVGRALRRQPVPSSGSSTVLRARRALVIQQGDHVEVRFSTFATGPRPIVATPEDVRHSVRRFSYSGRPVSRTMAWWFDSWLTQRTTT